MDICAIYGFCVGGKSFHYSNPSLAQTYIHFYELILLVRLPYVIGELFSKYQPGTKRTCLIIVILRNLHAATLCSTLFRRRQSVILFRRLWRLPIGQYNMSAPTRDYYSEMICILRINHRLRKYPWISAQTMDPSSAGRSMDIADPQIAPNIDTVR